MALKTIMLRHKIDAKEASLAKLHEEGEALKTRADEIEAAIAEVETEEAEKIILAIGNTAGVGSVESELIVNKEAPAAVFYTVVKGDTLWKIAEEHYGKGKGAKYTEIVKANTPPVKNPDLIQPGWVLRIPPLA